MQLKEVVIQGLIKKAGEKNAAENFRNELSNIDNRMERLAEEVLAIYGRSSNNYGCFDTNKNSYPFSTNLEDYYKNIGDLVSLSHSTCRLIASRMVTAATGGYICFLRYQNLGRDWLLIVVLKLETKTGINQKTLDLNESLVFDINNLHEAARIDLDKWQTDDQPYLSFIKNSKRKDRVTEYFRLALGCTDYTDSQSHTDQALKAMNEFFKENSYTAEQRQEVNRKAYEYFDEKSKKKEPVNLQAFSSIINDQEPDSFLNFVKDNEYQISETFEPHARTYMRIKRISGKFGNVSVAFDVQDVIDGTVDYDESTKKLILDKPASALINKIKEAKGESDEPSADAS